MVTIIAPQPTPSKGGGAAPTQEPTYYYYRKDDKYVKATRPHPELSAQGYTLITRSEYEQRHQVVTITPIAEKGGVVGAGEPKYEETQVVYGPEMKPVQPEVKVAAVEILKTGGIPSELKNQMLTSIFYQKVPVTEEPIAQTITGFDASKISFPLGKIQPQVFREPSKPSFLEKAFYTLVPFPKYEEPSLHKAEIITTTTTVKTTTQSIQNIYKGMEDIEARVTQTPKFMPKIEPITTKTIVKTTTSPIDLRETYKGMKDIGVTTTQTPIFIPKEEKVTIDLKSKIESVVESIKKDIKGLTEPVDLSKAERVKEIKGILKEEDIKESVSSITTVRTTTPPITSLYEAWEKKQEWVETEIPFGPEVTESVFGPRVVRIKELKSTVEVKKAMPYFAIGASVGLGVGAVVGTLATVAAVSTGAKAATVGVATFGMKAVAAVGTGLYAGQLIKEKRWPTTEEMGLITGGIVGGYIGYSMFKPRITTETQVQKFFETEWKEGKKYGYATGKIWTKVESPVLEKRFETDISSIWKSVKTERPSVYTRAYSYMIGGKDMNKFLAYSESEALAGIHYKGLGFMVSKEVPGWATVFTEGKLLSKSTMKIIDYSSQSLTKYLGERTWFWEPGTTKYYATIGEVMAKKPSVFAGVTKIFEPGKEIPFIKGEPKPMKPFTFIAYESSLDAVSKAIGQSSKAVEHAGRVSGVPSMAAPMTIPFVPRVEEPRREGVYPPSGPEFPVEWTKISEAWAGKKPIEEEYEYIVTPTVFREVIRGEKLAPRVTFKSISSQVTGVGRTTGLAMGEIQESILNLGGVSINIQEQAQRQTQGQMQRLMQQQRQMTRQMFKAPTQVPTYPSYPFMAYAGPFYPRFYGYRPYKPSVNLKRIIKGYKRPSKLLPTASLINIEKTYRKYGKWSMPRGVVPERMFWKGFEAKGVFQEFPTQQQLKKVLGGARKVAKKSKKKKK